MADDVEDQICAVEETPALPVLQGAEVPRTVRLIWIGFKRCSSTSPTSTTGGFTESVMANLPARRHKPRAWVMAISCSRIWRGRRGCAARRGEDGPRVVGHHAGTRMGATPGLLVAGLATVGAAAIVGLVVIAAEV